MLFRFGVYEFDVDRVEIRHEGAVVPVQPQVFSVIEFLIEHRDRVVTKEETSRRVWGDRFVSESALTSRIKSARRALGDSGTKQLVIRTVQGRGYRFVADLTSDDTRAPAPSAAPIAAPKHTRLSGESGPLNRATIGRWSDATGIWQRSPDCSRIARCQGFLDHRPRTGWRDSLRRRVQGTGRTVGSPVVRIVGLASASLIPLAVMSHVLPDEVMATNQIADDLARAEILRKARGAMESSAGTDRLMMIIENAQELDTMTSTLLGTLMMQGSAFGVVTRHPLVASQPEGGSQLLREIELECLGETDIDILLHRVLGGPIASSTLQVLIEMSDGRPVCCATSSRPASVPTRWSPKTAYGAWSPHHLRLRSGMGPGTALLLVQSALRKFWR